MKRRLLGILFSAAFVLTLLPVSALGVFYDVEGHWAQREIENWSDMEILMGWNGSFYPDEPITRGEMAIVLERIMGYGTASENTFEDLSQAYYTQAVLKANAAGVLLGSEGFLRPDDSMTREETAVLFCRVFGIGEDTSDSGFTDAAEISVWARGYVNALADDGYIRGRNGKFDPQRPITRAETVKILDNIVSLICNRAQEYSEDVSGVVIVNTSGAVLRDMTIDGDLILAEGIGDGEVTLDHVVVTGRTFIRGGGANSVYIEGGSALSDIIIEKTEAGEIRVVTSGGASVFAVYVDDGCDDVILTGTFTDVTITSGVTVRAVGAAVQNMTVSCADAELFVDSASSVALLMVEAPASVTNVGLITTAVIESDGVVIDGNSPLTVSLSSGASYPTNSFGIPVTGAPAADSSPEPPAAVPLTSLGPIQGMARNGETLSAGSVVPKDGTAVFQWSLSSDGVDFEDLEGATGYTYTIGTTDTGKWIRVTATGTGGYSGSVTSDAVYVAALGSDASLSALSYKVGGGSSVALTGFDPDTGTYSVTLPYGTGSSAVITLSGTLSDSYASIIENDGVTLDSGEGSASILVMSENGVFTRNYVVNFETAEPSHIATLSSSIGTVDDAAGTITGIPGSTTLSAFEAALTPAAGAVFETYELDGTTVATDLKTGYQVIVTAQDGVTHKTYTLTLLPSSDATLSYLTYSVDGGAPTGRYVYIEETTLYIFLDYGTNTAAQVALTATAANSGAQIAYDPQTVTLSGGTGSSSITVTAEDGITKRTYPVNIIINKNDDPTLSSLSYSVNGGSFVSVPGFSSSNHDYTIVLPAGTNPSSVIALSGTTKDPNASITHNPGLTLNSGVGITSIIVLAEDGATSLTYTVRFLTAS
ncbi:S-layer homology domain-containing protein [Papillibacter cinnamivorans]|uniref:S-layer homology domain-containing protein n=1 Tax=Papillibacter cinnamivorans DSM 12816 TaxID=1122930 RepID=A0A1W1YFU5_9FIRM|nr:S-layer homology domain-containing protein [Papillibacter cinnamivorans]SMC34648.1 S-layer homology domain-containing protein [Papillibacter cinnamivorans DSM 12816]